MRHRFANIAAGALLLGATALAAPAMVTADDDEEFGAYLYASTCDDLDTAKIVEDVGDLELEDDADDAAKDWMLLGNGQNQPTQLYVEDEDLENLTLDDLTGTNYAVAAHAEDSKDADVIACGDITGTPQDGEMLIELTEVDGSGFEGRAHFGPTRKGDEIEVTTGIWPAGDVPPLASPAASTPAA